MTVGAAIFELTVMVNVSLLLVKSISLFVLTLILTACTGDQGPMGPPGYDGIDGTNGNDGSNNVSNAFEKTVSFNAANNFEFTQKYGFKVLESDVTLVYILWETLDGTVNGTKVWRMLPQTVLLDEGLLFYNFDFTRTDVRFFLDSNFDLNLLGAGDTQDQVFRVVVVPADDINGVDVSNLKAVMQLKNIQSFDIK